MTDIACETVRVVRGCFNQCPDATRTDLLQRERGVVAHPPGTICQMFSERFDRTFLMQHTERFRRHATHLPYWIFQGCHQVVCRARVADLPERLGAGDT